MMAEPPIKLFVMGRTCGAMRRNGRWPAPWTRPFTCTRTAASAPRLRARRRRIATRTILLIRLRNVFKRGHRIGLQITSSCFPRWDCNPNTGHPFGVDAELQVARQEILHDQAHPSHVVLPLVPM